MPFSFPLTLPWLTIKKIECTDLHNVELLGKNDVYCLIDWSGVIHYKSRTQPNAGANAVYEDDNMLMTPPKIRVNELTSVLRVSVYDYNDFRPDVLIGKANIDISSIQINTFEKFKFELFNLKGKKTGAVTLELKVENRGMINAIDDFSEHDLYLLNSRESKAYASLTDIDYSERSDLFPAKSMKDLFTFPLTTPVLHIKSLECDNLKNVETFGSKNDVYVLFDWCGAKYRTYTQDNIGTKAIYEGDKDTKMFIQPSVATSTTLKIAVFDENSTRADVLIGYSEVDMYAIEDSKPLVLTSNIYDFRHQLTGTLKLTVVINNGAAVRVIDTDEVENQYFVEGASSEAKPVQFPLVEGPLVMHIKTIHCRNIKNVEMFGKNDLYVKINWGDYKMQTQVKNETGSEAIFDNPGMMLRPTCSANAGVNSIIRVRVLDQNTSSDVKIGETEVNVAPLMWDKFKAIDFDILDKNNKNTGTVRIILMLQSRKQLSKVDNLIMSRPNIKLLMPLVECTKLKNMRQVPTSKNDVFFEASWNNVAAFQSDISMDAGAQAVFVPMIEGEIMLKPSAGTLPKTSTILFRVYDSSNFRAPKLIGMADMDISPLALDTLRELESDIFDVAGEVTGHIMFKSILTTKDVEFESSHKQTLINHGSFWKNLTSKESIEVLERSGWHKNSSAIAESMWFERTNFQVLITNIIIFLLAFMHVLGCCFCYYFGWKTVFIFSWFLSNILCVHYLAFGFVLLSLSRTLGYISGLAIRRYMNQTFKYCGHWDIHFGYISLFITLDKIQLTAHNIVWRNHENFTQTPFFLHVNEITVKMHPKDLFEYLTKRRVVKLDEAVIDGLEAYIEKSDLDPTEMNLWHCLGMNEASNDSNGLRRTETEKRRNKQSKKHITEFLKSIGNKVRHKMGLGKVVPTIPGNSWNVISPPPGADKLGSNLKLYGAAVGSFVESSVGTAVNTFGAATNRHSTVANSAHTESDSNSGSVHTSGKKYGSMVLPPTLSEKINSDKEEIAITGEHDISDSDLPIVDISRLVIYKLNAHILDFVTTKHSKPTSQSDIRITKFLATRKDFTNKARVRVNDEYWGHEEACREAVGWPELISKLTTVGIDAVVAENWDNAGALLAKGAASNTKAAVINVADSVSGFGSSALKILGLSSGKKTEASPEKT